MLRLSGSLINQKLEKLYKDKFKEVIKLLRLNFNRKLLRKTIKSARFGESIAVIEQQNSLKSKQRKLKNIIKKNNFTYSIANIAQNIVAEREEKEEKTEFIRNML